MSLSAARYPVRAFLVRRVLAPPLLLFLLASCDGGGSPQEHLERGMAFQKEGELSAAVIEFKNVLQERPDHGEARRRLGEIYLLLGNGAAATKELDLAVKHGIRGVDIDMARMRALLLERRFKEALQRLASPAQGWDPAEVLVLRGMAHLGLGKIDAAEGEFHEALAIDARRGAAHRGLASVALGRDDAEEARRRLHAAIEATPADVDAWILLGTVENYYGDHEAAEKAFRGALQRVSSSTIARLGLAESLIGQARFEEAAEATDRAAARLPDGHPAPGYLRALAALRQGNLVEARRHLGKVLSHGHDYLPAVYLMSTIHYRSREYAQARFLARRFVERAPANSDGLRLLAAIHLRIEEPGEAIRRLEEALERAPQDASLHAMLGEAYVQKGRFEDAARAFETAARLSPDDSAIRTELARGYLAGGDTGKAVTVLESLAESDATAQSATHLLVATHMRRGNYDSAIAVAEELGRRQPRNPMPHIYMGDAYAAGDEPARARAAYEQALAIDPESALARSQLAKLDLEGGDAEVARERLEAILASDSADVAALRGAAAELARMDLANGDAASAEARFRAVLQRSPNDVFALTALAELAAAEGRIREGIAHLERAREHDPEALGPLLMLTNYYIRAGDTARAIQVAQQAHAIAPEDARTLLLLGSAQAAAGAYEDAVATGEKLVAMEPDSVSAHIRLANTALQAGKTGVARQALERTLALDPDHLQAKLALGELSLRTGRPAQALAIARELDARLPDAAAPAVLEGDALMAQGMPSEAAAAYRTALARSDDGETAVKLYKAESRAGREQQARRDLEAWLAAHPEDPDVLVAAALLAYQDGREDLAASRYEKALEGQPDNLLALNNLAWLYHERRDARALELAERAYRARPGSPEVLDTYGWLLVEGNHNERGIALLRKAVEASPDAPTARYHLAAALAKVGEVDAARRHLETALSSTDRFPERARAATLHRQLELR